MPADYNGATKACASPLGICMLFYSPAGGAYLTLQYLTIQHANHAIWSVGRLKLVATSVTVCFRLDGLTRCLL